MVGNVPLEKKLHWELLLKLGLKHSLPPLCSSDNPIPTSFPIRSTIWMCRRS